jgi:type I restriction enzyme S subunit
MIFRRLSEVAPPSASRTKPGPTETVWHLTLDQIESGSGRVDHRVYGYASEAASSSFVFDKGNVLYSKLRPYLNKVICPDTNGVATTELVPLRPNPAELNREYLCFFLRSPVFVSWASGQVDGAKMPRMKMKAFWAYEVPVPPLDDQIRIARLLGQVEGLIAQRRQHLKQLDDLLKSVFLEMFGDPVRNEKGWDKAPLEELGSLDRGVSKHRPRNAPQLLGGKYPLIQTGEVSSAGTFITTFTQTYSDVGFAQSKLWLAGTLCITIAANIAKTSILTFDACFPDSVVGFTASRGKANVQYVHGLFWFFQSILERNAPAAAQKNINLEILRGLQVPQPPCDLQNRFAGIVNSIEGLRTHYQQSLSGLEALYGALSQQVFKAELDLSRVPMPRLEPEADKTVGTEPLHTPADQGLAINFPETANVLDALETSEAREALISQWLEAYRGQLGRRPFSVQHFMAAAQDRLAELQPDNDCELGATDYERIKAWVFAALAAGTLTQAFDDAGNRIELKAERA